MDRNLPWFTAAEGLFMRVSAREEDYWYLRVQKLTSFCPFDMLTRHKRKLSIWNSLLEFIAWIVGWGETWVLVARSDYRDNKNTHLNHCWNQWRIIWFQSGFKCFGWLASWSWDTLSLYSLRDLWFCPNALVSTELIGINGWSVLQMTPERRNVCAFYKWMKHSGLFWWWDKAQHHWCVLGIFC